MEDCIAVQCSEVQIPNVSYGYGYDGTINKFRIKARNWGGREGNKTSILDGKIFDPANMIYGIEWIGRTYRRIGLEQSRKPAPNPDPNPNQARKNRA